MEGRAAARPEDLAFVPDAIDDVVAASLPVAYLTAQITLTLAGFKPGMTVLAPGISPQVPCECTLPANA